MERKENWVLIDNDNHDLLYFTSQARLRRYAKDHGMVIRRSYTSERCFYTESYEWLPGNS